MLGLRLSNKPNQLYTDRNLCLSLGPKCFLTNARVSRLNLDAAVPACQNVYPAGCALSGSIPFPECPFVSGAATIAVSCVFDLFESVPTCSGYASRREILVAT